MKKDLVYQDEVSNKFWRIETEGKSFIVTFGKIGTSGQSKTKEFANKELCEKEAERLIAEKLKKGYIFPLSDRNVKKENSASSGDNMANLWKRLEKWFKKNHPGLMKYLNKNGATDKDFGEFEKITGQKLPESFKKFYKIHNGWNGCFIGFVESFLSIKEMIDSYYNLGEFPEFNNRYAFTVSSRGRDHYWLEMKPDSEKRGNVIFLSTDFDEVEYEADSFEEWIEKLVSDIENGKYDKDFGNVENDEDDKDARPDHLGSKRIKKPANKKIKNEGSPAEFPFFGAGDAEYFEWAEIAVRFVNKPDKDQIDIIKKSAPKPIKPAKDSFYGKMLLTGSDQFVNMYIEEAYGKSNLKDLKFINDEESSPFDEDSGCFDVSEKAADAFETDIVRWLNEIHSYCPIEFVYRREDDEAGGTKLSEWHTKSLETIPALIEKWEKDPYTYIQGAVEKENFIYAVSGIFDFGDVKYEKVSENFIEAFFPARKLDSLLKKADLKEALTFFRKNHKNGAINDLIAEKLNHYLQKKNKAGVDLISAFMTEAKLDENEFIKCALFYSDRNDFENALRVSLEGIKKYPESDTIVANILYSAEKSKKQDVVAKYINKKSKDPLILANQSFSMVKSGKLKEAYDLLFGHLKDKGEFNQYSLNNLLYLCTNYKMPEEPWISKIIDLSEENFVKNVDYRNLDFTNNLIILFNNRGEFKKSFDTISLYRCKGGEIGCSLSCNYTYAALMTHDLDIIKKTLEDVIKIYNKNKKDFNNDSVCIPILLGNLAGMYAKLSNKEKMLEFLKMTKKVHPNFRTVKQDTDFEAYWEDKDFKNI